MTNRCSNCGTELPAGARFCPSCGTPTSAATPVAATPAVPAAPASAPAAPAPQSTRLAGERKPVTALFADVVGSVTLAERMDPEDWSGLMSRAVGEIEESVRRYDGSIASCSATGYSPPSVPRWPTRTTQSARSAPHWRSWLRSSGSARPRTCRWPPVTSPSGSASIPASPWWAAFPLATATART